MALLKEWRTGHNAQIAIWQIEEPEAFFLSETGLNADMKSERRRIEYLAARFLLQHIYPGFPIHEIQKDDQEKPRIADNKLFFSISHSWPYVAVVIDADGEVGIDIQTWHKSIFTVQRKFLSEREQELFGNDQKLLTLAWSAKEAAYKWNGRRAVDFIDHLPIQNFREDDLNKNIKININSNGSSRLILVESLMESDFVCSIVVGNVVGNSE